MKKFLSLVMALVMTMSLVTIGAGATEYKDLTDKDEIQYEEAVAVLNKLGIISGYEDGSFRPTGALTRGAAAKIIVSLMIGPEAANALTVNAAPYSDVPVTNTFAAVISYCKTAGYINGYTDGTFRPAAALTGYAFTKMLLGALGYDGVQEGFTGEGWIMNVSRLGNAAGLFNDFNTAFKGNDGVDRESACLLALNTLKATQVEYSGGTNITTSTGDATTNVTTNKVRSYKVSNNTTINKNIFAGDAQSATGNYFTLEFGEEHFQDLVLDNEKYNTTYEDSYGRPSNQWSLKNVKIGTYPITANYTYTEGASGDTDVDKVKSMGLKDYEFDRDANAIANTILTVNGQDRSTDLAHGATTLAANAKLLKDYTKNGALVQIYLNKNNANIISHIAVTETQIMQVNRVTSGDVTLKKVEDRGIAISKAAVVVNAVEDDDVLYDALKDLKSDDYVVVTPLYNGTTYDVDAVFIPTTATGSITRVNVNAANDNTSGLTIADTEYKMSKNWTAEDAGSADPYTVLNGSSVSNRQESTVYLDAYGYAIYVDNVKASTNYFLFDESYSTIVDGRIHYFAQGWDTKGNEVSLDFGTTNPNLTTNNVYAYKVAGNNSNADYQLDAAKQSSNVVPKTGLTVDAADTALDGKVFTSGVKFIFPSVEGGDITGVTVKDGAQRITVAADLTYVLDDNNRITAVFLKNDSEVEVSQNVLYAEKQTAVSYDADGKRVSVFTAYIDGVKHTNLVANRLITDNTFYTYSVNDSTGVYTVSSYTSQASKGTSVVTGGWLARGAIVNNAYVNTPNLYLSGTVAGGALSVGDSTLTTNLNLANATIIDLRTGGTLSSAKDMADYRADASIPSTYTSELSYKVSLVYNDSSSSSSRGRVSYLFILDTVDDDPTPATKYAVAAPNANWEVSLDNSTFSASVSAIQGQMVYLRLKSVGAGTALAVDTTVAMNSNVDNLTKVDEGQYTFVTKANAVVTGDYTTVTVKSVDEVKYVATAASPIRVSIKTTGSPSDEVIENAVVKALTTGGYGITSAYFTSPTFSGADLVIVRGAAQETIPAAKIKLDIADVVDFKVGTADMMDLNTNKVATVTVAADSANSFVYNSTTNTYVAGDSMITAGAVYGTDEYVVFTAGSHVNVSGFTVTYKADGVAIADGDKIKVGVTLETTLTATGDISNSAYTSTYFKVASAGGSDAITYSGTCAFGSAVGGAIESTETNTGNNAVNSGDTFVITHNTKPASNSAFTSPAITVTSAG